MACFQALAEDRARYPAALVAKAAAVAMVSVQSQQVSPAPRAVPRSLLESAAEALNTTVDYLIWGKGVDHSWVAEEESVVLTVRWPSVPGYAVPHSGGS